MLLIEICGFCDLGLNLCKREIVVCLSGFDLCKRDGGCEGGLYPQKKAMVPIVMGRKREKTTILCGEEGGVWWLGGKGKG